MTTTGPADTTFLDISCTDPSPAAAQAYANSFALAYINDRRESGREEYASIPEPLQEQIRRVKRRLDSLHRRLARADGAQRDAVLGRLSSFRSDRDAVQLQLLAIRVPSARPALPAAPAGLPVRPSNGGFVACPRLLRHPDLLARGAEDDAYQGATLRFALTADRRPSRPVIRS